jgi:hypothetical protein
MLTNTTVCASNNLHGVTEQMETIPSSVSSVFYLNPLNAELNPVCHLLALLGARHIFHVSELRVNKKTFDPFIFEEYPMSGVVYLGKFHEFFTPILIKGCNGMLLQQDRVPYPSILSIPGYLRLGISWCPCSYFVIKQIVYYVKNTTMVHNY